MNTPSAFTADALSENLRCPAGALTALAGAAQPMLRVSAAIRRFCPQIVIRTLAGDDLPMVRMSAARNQRCPSDVLAELAQDPDPQVRESVAANPVCSPDLLTELTGDATVLVRCAVADHPACNPDLLAMLANDRNDLVRCHTAKNSLCPPRALVRLADDPEEMIAEAAAGNPRCPAEILERFCDDAYVASRTDNICAAAAANPSIPLAAFDHISADDCAVASGDAVSDPACPQRLLEVLARFAPECSASEAAASNQNCPPEALKIFASSESFRVRCRAASNPATPSSVLAVLSNDTNTAVAVTAALNPSTPWAGLRDCARRLAAEQRAEQRSEQRSWHAPRSGLRGRGRCLSATRRNSCQNLTLGQERSQHQSPAAPMAASWSAGSNYRGEAFSLPTQQATTGRLLFGTPERRRSRSRSLSGSLSASDRLRPAATPPSPLPAGTTDAKQPRLGHPQPDGRPTRRGLLAGRTGSLRQRCRSCRARLRVI